MAESLPEHIRSDDELDEILSRPSAQLVALMRRLQGDLVVLGAGGKIGVTLCRTAVRAIEAAGVKKKVIAVDLFPDAMAKDLLVRYGAEPVACNLLDRAAVAKLPQAPNVIFMAGRKFGTQGAVEMTWAMNVMVPHNCAEHFQKSRIVVFSTGCVYPLATAASGGCTEEIPPAPVGEYAQSSLGRERVFGYYSQNHGTRVCLYRLNYAVELRYGVLFDIGTQVFKGEPVNNNVGQINCLWQGDVNNHAILALDLCESPYGILNDTGPETLATRFVGEEFARHFGKKATYLCEQEGPVGYLSNPSRALDRFGYPTVAPRTILRWIAEWMQQGGRSLGKPTHFEVSDGKF